MEPHGAMMYHKRGQVALERCIQWAEKSLIQATIIVDTAAPKGIIKETTIGFVDQVGIVGNLGYPGAVVQWN